MKFLLDTHTLLWWALDHGDLPRRHAAVLEKAEKQGVPVGLSVISLWEIAKLVALEKFRISYSLDVWFDELSESPALEILPLTPRIILDSNRLGKAFPKDPADQLIAATARAHGLTLLTEDKRIRASGVVAVA